LLDSGASCSVTHASHIPQSTQEESLKEDDETTGLEIAEGKAAMHDVNEMEDNVMDDDEKVKMLNKDQRRVFDISEHLLHQRKHELGECTCTLETIQVVYEWCWWHRQIISDRNYQA